MKNYKSKTLKEIFVEAFTFYKKKDFKNAENTCYKILSIDPGHFDSISLLATISAINNNFDKAKQLLLKAITIQPKNVSAINNLGTACKELGDQKEAINHYKKVLQLNPNHTNAHYNLGLIYYELKELEKAKSYFEKTIEIQNNYALPFFSLGNVYVDLKDFNNAISCYQKAIELNPNLLGAHNNLGLVFRIVNDFQNSISCFEKVIKIKPDHVGAQHNLGSSYRELGQFDKAIKSYELAIKYEPDNATHYYYLSQLKNSILDSNLQNKIKKIIEKSNFKNTNIAFGNFLLSFYEKESKNFEKELDYLKKAHKGYINLKKEKFKLGIKYVFEDVLQIAEGVSISKLNYKDDYNVKPIFIIGVPRCGSTLIEKIIGSGKKMIPMGEETAVFENYITQKILDKKSLNLGDAATIRNELYDIYKQKGLISKSCDYVFTDKSLNNFFYLDIIKTLYPGSKIINCKRDIISSIMSIYQNNLTDLAWTHDLDNIFKYFNNYFEIIRNFNEVYPNFIYELEYEKLVNSPKEESKNLMKFCDLPWDKKCLEFYKRKDIISKTASNIQIRKAVYKGSSEKYLPYKKFLKKYGEKYSWFR